MTAQTELGYWTHLARSFLVFVFVLGATEASFGFAVTITKTPPATAANPVPTSVSSVTLTATITGAPTSTAECNVLDPVYEWSGAVTGSGASKTLDITSGTSPLSVACKVTYNKTARANAPAGTACPAESQSGATDVYFVVGWRVQPEVQTPAAEKSSTTKWMCNVYDHGSLIPMQFGSGVTTRQYNLCTVNVTASGYVADPVMPFCVNDPRVYGFGTAPEDTTASWKKSYKWVGSETPEARSFNVSGTLSVWLKQVGCSDNDSWTKAWAQTSSQGTVDVNCPGGDADASFDRNAGVSQKEQDSFSPTAGWPPELTYTSGNDEWIVGPDTLSLPLNRDFPNDGKNAYADVTLRVAANVCWDTYATGPQTAQAKAWLQSFSLKLLPL